jgi:hypothetical protein
MAREGTPDPVSEAFRRISQDARARRTAGTSPVGGRPGRVMVALFVLVLAIIVLGVLALSGWLPGIAW